jgi:tetratricopeptide (TPR) repeat protein
MLVQRRYASLWPRLQEIAGQHLEKVRASSAAAAEQAVIRSPDDHEALADLANAFRHSGRLDEAIKLKSKVPAQSQMSSADEQMGWLVNNIALAMHEAGRAEEADALFAQLNDAPMAKESWRVSMKINRLELLVLDGKFERALPLIEPTARAEGTDYAEQLVRRLRYCATARLGRTAESASLETDLLAHAKDAPGPTIDGLLCAGQIDKAEKVALASLKDADEASRRDFEADFVRQLQSKSLTSDDPSVWQDRWQDLRRRPAIAAEFNRLGRDMPIDYLVPKPRA